LWRVALVLLLFFGIVELFMRLVLFEISKDLRRFQLYPSRAAQLHAAPKLRVAILGNSASEAGIDIAAFQKGLAAQKIAVSSDIFLADSSQINTWQHIANHLFWVPARAPDVLVVPYFGTSLSDRNDIEIGRLAQFFTAPREIPTVMRDLPDTASRLDFAVSSVWATYAARTRLKERVLTLVVPDYQRVTTEFHALNSPAVPAAVRPSTYRNLDRLLEAARAHDCRVVLVALPLRDNYSIKPNLPSRVRAAGATFLDLRQLPGLKPSLYADSVHFTPSGRAFFTPHLARALAPVLPRQ